MNERFPVQRARLPEDIEREMGLWRDGLVRMPISYIAFHKHLAERRLKELQAAYKFRVVESRMRRGGWLDGMCELNSIIETRKGHVRQLVWHDGNQDFMISREFGLSQFGEDDLL